MKRILLLSFFISVKLLAQEPIVFDKIPKDLLENANAVLQYDEQEFTILSESKIQTKRNWAVTILNETGYRQHGMFVAYYSSLSKLEDISCSLYSKTGEKIKSLKKRDFQEINVGGDDISDTKVVYAGFVEKAYEYPITITFSYTRVSENSLFYPEWQPKNTQGTSIISSRFAVETPSGIPFRYMERMEGIETFGKSYTSKEWIVKNLVAKENINFSKNLFQNQVVLAPVNGDLQGLKVNCETWKNAGKFYYDLNKDRQQLPEEILKALNSKILDSDSRIEKIKKVYEFVQSSTRYVSIQLGIGGWQSSLASDVATKGYGDCKALTNYTIAIFNAIGIEAYPALIGAGEDNYFEFPDFPRLNFNHVIACLPSSTDTTWLECTSPTNPMGYLGNFTGNRKALLIKPSGGELVNTIQYKAEDNLQLRKVKVLLEEDGIASFKLINTYSGIQQEYKATFYSKADQNRKEVYLKESMGLSSIEDLQFAHEITRNKLPFLTENMSFRSKRFCTKSGTRLFLPVLPFPLQMELEIPKADRMEPFFLNPNVFEFVDVDSYEFTLPKNSKIEYMPKPVSIDREFGTYSLEIARKEDILMVKQVLQINAGLYPATAFKEFYDFVKEIQKLGKSKAVLVLEET